MRSRAVRVVTVDAQTPSPFAASLLFGYVANYLYDGDAPLAERRAQALSVDQAQLRELLGEAELRDAARPRGAGRRSSATLQQLPERSARAPTDGVHDLLLRLGDLDAGRDRRARRCRASPAPAVDELVARRRALPVRLAGEPRLIAVEDAAPLPRRARRAAARRACRRRCSSRRPTPSPTWSRRYARTHGPFTAAEAAARFGVGEAVVEATLRRLRRSRPRGRGRVPARRPADASGATPTCCATLRRRSLAALRKEVEPVEPHVLGRFSSAGTD